jgi:hypothetical protein
MMAAAERFLAKHLGGRFQEGASTEVAVRLKQIEVDPKTVVLAKKVDATAVGVPKLAATLQPGTHKYKAVIQMGEQSVKLEMATEIKEEGGGWLITDTVQSPMGAATDIVVVDKTTLALLKRSVKQGPMTMTLEFKDNKASGSMAMRGKERPIAIELGGPLFGDAAGQWQELACLPLAEGYSITYRNLDVQRQKVKLMQLKVVGSESVTVSAGTFDVFKVEVTPAEGGSDKVTLWIAKESRKVAKASAVLAQSSGAVMTAELQ